MISLGTSFITSFMIYTGTFLSTSTILGTSTFLYTILSGPGMCLGTSTLTYTIFSTGTCFIIYTGWFTIFYMV